MFHVFKSRSKTEFQVLSGHPQNKPPPRTENKKAISTYLILHAEIAF